jgi:hypothetical protein
LSMVATRTSIALLPRPASVTGAKSYASEI